MGSFDDVMSAPAMSAPADLAIDPVQAEILLRFENLPPGRRAPARPATDNLGVRLGRNFGSP
jgi:hypothetical protein